MTGIQLSSIPRIYQHALVFTAFSLGATGAGVVSHEWSTILGSGWCFVAIAWFPSACLEFFRRARIDNFIVAAGMLSMVAGFDGVLRLVRQYGGSC